MVIYISVHHAKAAHSHEERHRHHYHSKCITKTPQPQPQPNQPQSGISKYVQIKNTGAEAPHIIMQVPTSGKRSLEWLHPLRILRRIEPKLLNVSLCSLEDLQADIFVFGIFELFMLFSGAGGSTRCR